MFTYKQSTGELLDADGKVIGIGYAGHGDGVNNPDKQGLRNIGPLPRGKYRIGQAIEKHPMLGPVAIPLLPLPETQMFGRNAFYMHGAKAREKARESSLGCIIQGPAARLKVAENAGNTLEVIV